MAGEKHTLGPWRVQSGFLTVYALSHGDHGTTIALAKTLYDEPNHTWSACPGQKEAEANARLIAAAPDLLFCLKHAVHWHDQLSTDDIGRFEEAIAKAEGRA